MFSIRWDTEKDAAFVIHLPYDVEMQCIIRDVGTKKLDRISRKSERLEIAFYNPTHHVHDNLARDIIRTMYYPDWKTHVSDNNGYMIIDSYSKLMEAVRIAENLLTLNFSSRYAHPDNSRVKLEKEIREQKFDNVV